MILSLLLTPISLMIMLQKPHNYANPRPLTKGQDALKGSVRSMIFAISLLFIASSCSLMQMQPKPIAVRTIAEMPNIYDPPLPLELQLVDIDWTIFTPELMQNYLDDIEKGDAPRQAFYALTTKDYENLSINTADQKRYLKEIIAIVGYYREIDEPKKVSEPK